MKVVTFNILSSGLANSDWFKNTSPEYLESDYRFNLLCNILDYFVSKSYIICLQEVSEEWNIKLKLYFSTKSYNYIPKIRNAKLGLATCVPSIYNVLDMYSPFVNKSVDKCFNEIVNVDDIIDAVQEEREVLIVEIDDHYSNIFIANIHMPCKFTKPLFMEVYTLALMKTINDFVGDRPVILLGDFNSKYEFNEYGVLINGPSKGINYELLKDELLKDNSFKPFIDARINKTSDITCIACQDLKNIGFSIDYIFHRGVNIIDYKVLSTNDESLPSIDFPSDHFPIYCEFTCEFTC